MMSTPASRDPHQHHDVHTSITGSTPASWSPHQHHEVHTSIMGSTPASWGPHQHQEVHTSITGYTPASRGPHQHHDVHTSILVSTLSIKQYFWETVHFSSTRGIGCAISQNEPQLPGTTPPAVTSEWEMKEVCAREVPDRCTDHRERGHMAS